MKNVIFTSSMTRVLAFLLFTLTGLTSYAQQDIDLTVRYNSSLARYEVFARPTFTQNNFTWGPSQITVVLPASMPNTALPTLTSFAAGVWGDNSIVYGAFGSDFHGVESSGQLVNAVANQEVLIFSFTLPGGCVAGVRLYINGVDPDSSQPGMGGGDFANTIDNGNITDVYNVNYNNGGSNCIDAVNDNAGPIAGITGGNTGVNVFTNDSGNGVTPLNPAVVVLTPGTDPNISIAPNGDIIVNPNTPAGTYTIPYTICEVGNPTNCDNAVVTVTVSAAPIVANDDTFGPILGTAGSANAGNAITNDLLNGAPAAFPNVVITTVVPANPIGGNPNVPSLNVTTGVVSVPVGTPAGLYTIGYTLCETLNPSNCDPATIVINVTAPAIIANDDPLASVNGTSGNPTAGNAFTNDLLNGVPVIPAQITASVTAPATPIGGGPVPTMNTTTGVVSVPAGTPAGNYTIGYQICQVLNPTNCDPAVITITVTPAAIIANDDPLASVNGTTGNPTAGNAFTNDLLNGAPVVPAQITATVTAPATPIGGGPVPTMNTTTGVVSVPAGTPAGNYTIGYQICQVLNPTNCDPAVITITVTAPTIIANDDPLASVNGTTGNPTAGNAFTNDILNGAPVVPAQITATVTAPATPIGGGPVPTMNTTTGVVSVPVGTPAGNYTIGYQICQILNPTNCDPAVITITVTPATIIANDDPLASVNGTNGNPTAGNAFTNDLLNGAPVVPAQITATVTAPATPIGGGPVPTMNTTTGVVSVPAGTPAGNYTIGYQICQILNPTNCDPAVITITVTPATIIANDDPLASVNGTNGNPTAGNAFTNDLLNGAPVVPSQITATVTAPATPIGGGPVPTMNTTTGVVSVPVGTPAGNYTIGYQICQNLNPTNCDPAVITITVTPAPIVANDDNYSATPINSVVGGTLPNIFGNDLLNNLPLVSSAVNFTTLAALPAGITINPVTGVITVAAGTTAGTYLINYQICQILNPTNCDPALITIVVLGADIIANDDNYSATPINDVTGFTGLFNVLSNDSYNGVPATTTNIVLTEAPGNNPAFNINPNGTIDLLDLSIPGGTYTLSYTICDITLPGNCDNATVTLVLEDKSVSLDVLLQGALFGTTTGIMRDDLRTNNVIPLLNPYSPAFFIDGNTRFARPDNSTAETINASLLTTTGNDAIVDWVFIELRDAANPATVLRTQAALVQRDGTIVGTTGSNKLFFANLTAANYVVTVKHRNHLGATTALPISFVNRRLIFDFTAATPATLWNFVPVVGGPDYTGFETTLDIPSNKQALWAGDVSSNGRVKYVGPQNDQTLVFQDVLNHPGNTSDNYNYNFATPLYRNSDVNLDAKVKYRGAGNDCTFIFFNVITKYAGLNTLSLYNYNLFIEQVPN